MFYTLWEKHDKSSNIYRNSAEYKRSSIPGTKPSASSLVHFFYKTTLVFEYTISVPYKLPKFKWEL